MRNGKKRDKALGNDFGAECGKLGGVDKVRAKRKWGISQRVSVDVYLDPY